MKILVSGASGFIGSAFVRTALQQTNYQIRAMVRQSNPERFHRRLTSFPVIEESIRNGRLEVIYSDLLGDLSGICEGIDVVVHAAAKTYVDHSIKDSLPFIETNVIGTYRLLEDARKHAIKKFLFVSTDETLGEILSGSYKEDAPANPRNPYAASKLAGEGISISYAHTYNLNTVITRMENIYGIPHQHPQKVFPTFVKHALKGVALPIYGQGNHIRQWLYLEDAIAAFLLLIKKDTKKGDIYHIAGNRELTNLDLAKKILKALGKSENQIAFIDDKDIRPGHDKRYSLNSDKIKALGWELKVGLDEGIEKTVKWYKDNPSWCE